MEKHLLTSSTTTLGPRVERRIPARLGKYTVFDCLGSGGFGSVHKAFDEVFQRFVAIKIYHQPVGGADTDQWHASFLLEARALVRLDHSNIVHILDATVQDGWPVIVMSLLEGESLRKLLSRTGVLPLAIVRNVVSRVGDALAHIHANGLVHADIKPENLIATESAAQVTVVDLGISRDLLSTGADAGAWGTPRYMAPELWRGEPPTYASDIYALALVSYEMLAGRPPFVGTFEEVMTGHLRDEPTPVSVFRATVPGEVDVVLREGLAKVPADRPSDVQAFAKRLEKALRVSETRSVSFVTRRVRNPVQTESDGVPRWCEVYFCSHCRDYFVVYATGEDTPQGFAVIDTTEITRDTVTGDVFVFCPICRTGYPEYGVIAYA